MDWFSDAGSIPAASTIVIHVKWEIIERPIRDEVLCPLSVFFSYVFKV